MNTVPPRVRDALWRSIATGDWALYKQVFKDAPDEETRRRYARIRDRDKVTLVQRLIMKREATPRAQWDELPHIIDYTRELAELPFIPGPSRVGEVIDLPLKTAKQKLRPV